MRKIETQLEDDLTGGPADETVTFGIDGRSYEIDLNSQHAADLRRQLGRFADHARQVPQQRRRTTRTAASRERSRQIRAWAEQHGLDISAHGRLPGHVIQQYEAEGGEEPAPARRSRGRGGDAGQTRAQASGRQQRRPARPPAGQGERRGPRRPRLGRDRRPARKLRTGHNGAAAQIADGWAGNSRGRPATPMPSLGLQRHYKSCRLLLRN